MRARVKEAQDTLDRLVVSNAPATVPADLTTVSDEDLENLKADLDQSRAEHVQNLQLWEQCGQKLQDALDATVMTVSLRSEPETKKRRRTTTGLSSGSAPAAGKSTSASTSSTGSNERRIGTKVAFRLPGTKPPDDEWILCEIVKVLQDGQRYEVQDPEPDENHQAGKIYRANVRDMMVLPPRDAVLPILESGALVLAQYPETTAFYRAEVSSCSARSCRLVFEGEEETGKETEVERHLVLSLDKN